MATDSAQSRVFNADDWISKSEAARVRGVSRQAIWELVNRGRLTTVTFAGRIYLDRSEVLKFKRRPRGPASQYESKGSEYKSKGKAGKRKKKTYDPSKWISLIEAARLRGVTRQVIADLIRRRRLRTLVFANKKLVLRSSVEKFKPLPRRTKSKSRRAKKK
jgi:predicted DNA-binding protein YlxM (UPF0122 family)